MQTLRVYELTEELDGPVAGGDELQQAVKRITPHGHMFKAVPMHFNHCSPPAILREILADAVACDIVMSDKHAAAFALRVQVTRFPEGIMSVWLLLAAKMPLV